MFVEIEVDDSVASSYGSAPSVDSHSAPASQTVSATTSTASCTKSVTSHTTGTLATPSVRALAKELKIDIALIKGTGADGRVLKEDVHNFVKKPKTAATETKPASTKAKV